MSYYTHLYPSRNVRPEVVYLLQIQCLLNCLHVIIIRDEGLYHFTRFRYSTLSCMIRLLSLHKVSLLYTFLFLNVLPEAVYCLFTRTTLFTTMFTVIIVVRSLKSMCIRLDWLLCE